MKRKKGFTVLELLIVVGIVGILSTIISSLFGGAREDTKRANALLEMRSIHNAVILLELDTGVMVGGRPFGTCSANDEYSFDPASPECGGGLICNTARLYPSGATYTYPGTWDGPYANEKVLEDPWGNYYLFDYDIHCGDGMNEIPTERCGGNDGIVVGITTGGPDGDFFTYNDNEVVVVCS